jgi:hypothetical protein
MKAIYFIFGYLLILSAVITSPVWLWLLSDMKRREKFNGWLMSKMKNH